MTASVKTATQPAPFLERCFLFDAVESDYFITQVTGRLPEWLRGTYYVNGPARFSRDGRQYQHWLDGDGMVCSLEFGEQLRFRCRFVRTRKLQAEDQAGRFLYRGFGTRFPGDQLRRNVMLESPVNVSVYPYDGRLLAFGEQSIPIELDATTLETRGEYDFHGAINEVSPFAAHAKIDGGNGHLVNFGVTFSATNPILYLYEFDDCGHQVARRRVPIGAQHSVHDFGLSPDYAVFHLSPLLLDFGEFWSEDKSVMEALSWRPQLGSQLLVVPRKRSTEPVFSVAAGNGYCLHVINCFEAGTLLIVDLLELEAPVYNEYQPVPDLFRTVTPCRPVRFVIDRETQRLAERIALDYDRTPDFPSLDPAFAGQPYEHFWMLGISASGSSGRKFFDQLTRGCWRSGATDIFTASTGHYLGGEPTYVGNPERRGEGVILVQHFRPESYSAEFLVFDAFQVQRGPIASIPLQQPIHPGFHTSFRRASEEPRTSK